MDDGCGDGDTDEHVACAVSRRERHRHQLALVAFDQAHPMKAQQLVEGLVRHRGDGPRRT
jgi:hypothetical protein